MTPTIQMSPETTHCSKEAKVAQVMPEQSHPLVAEPIVSLNDNDPKQVQDGRDIL